MPKPNNPPTDIHRLHVIIEQDQYIRLHREAARQSMAGDERVSVAEVLRKLIDRAFPPGGKGTSR